MTVKFSSGVIVWLTTRIHNPQSTKCLIIVLPVVLGREKDRCIKGERPTEAHKWDRNAKGVYKENQHEMSSQGVGSPQATKTASMLLDFCKSLDPYWRGE